MLSNVEMLDLLANVKYDTKFNMTLYKVGYRVIDGEESESYTTIYEVIEKLQKGNKKDKEKALYLLGIKDGLEILNF